MALVQMLFWAIPVGALICLIAFWLGRERSRTAAAKAARDDLIASLELEDAYVSGEDGSLIGLSFATGLLTVGTLEHRRRLPFRAIRAVEGVRDGVVLVRTGLYGERTATPTDPAAPPPVRIHALSLRITVDEPEPAEHSVLFVDGGKIGLEPTNQHLRQQAALAEAWFRKLTAAMDAAR